MDSDHKIIGYFAYFGVEVFCDHGACVIAGTAELLASYIKLSNLESAKEDIIKKTRFGEIIRGFERGGAYAFDKEAYSRFLPLMKQRGVTTLPELKDCFLKPSPDGFDLIRVEFRVLE